jgi:hypothetical protein
LIADLIFATLASPSKTNTLKKCMLPNLVAFVKRLLFFV